MDITQYYKKAKLISDCEGNEIPKLIDALNYGEEDDHPSSWVPKVQSALLEHFKLDPNSKLSDEILALYIQGAIMEKRAESNLLVKVGFGCLVAGLFLGWLLWE
ncbi:MAG: hypothetical protein HWE27_17895 [Gammaproteobacteria bacterium]|nr:hypothetical protein [Gammaproteobacteria bacterium]